MIADKVDGARILDLFAGTGAFGIDGVSRGATHCTFIDLDPRWLKENLKLIDSDQYTLKRGDCFRVLGKLDGPYDIIIADPPYETYSAEKLLRVISQNKLLANTGVLIYEECSRASLNIGDCGFEVVDFRKYGETGIHVLRLSE